MQPRILYPARLSFKIEEDSQTKTKGVRDDYTSPARNFKGDSLKGEKLKNNKTDQMQQRLERTGEHHQKLPTLQAT